MHYEGNLLAVQVAFLALTYRLLFHYPCTVDMQDWLCSLSVPRKQVHAYLNLSLGEKNDGEGSAAPFF